MRSTSMHPLDPLDAHEIDAVVAAVRASERVPNRVRFISVTLHEPPKDVAWEQSPRQGYERAADLVLLEPTTGLTHEIRTTIATGELTSLEAIGGVQPMITGDEAAEAESLVREDERFAAALARRGVKSPGDVMIDIESIGSLASAEHRGRRLAWGSVWARETAAENGYGRPVEGVVPIVDLNSMTVLDVEDDDVIAVAPFDDGSGEDGEPPSPLLRGLEIVQPDGPSFELEGHRLRWQDWDLRIGFTPREGLVLHTLAFTDGGRPRSILHRASVSEMVVPYGSPGQSHYRKNFFDVGEYGAGLCTNSLKLGCECLGEVRYLDAVVTDSDGGARTIANAICIHEEDVGILWKHLDARSGQSTVARARRLVISSIATYGNYDYGYYWYLYQDGAIEFEAKLTGVVSTAASDGTPTRFGTPITEHLTAPNHQHFFNVRLDMRVEGDRNSVAQLDCFALDPGEDNPHGTAFEQRATSFATELEARSQINLPSARCWRIFNPEVRNQRGVPVGYRLIPGQNTQPFAEADCSVRRRARFLDYHVWVTPYDPDEMFAAGAYPNQSEEDSGLGSWTAADRPIADRDIVVWHTVGSTHVVRLEDWPIMSVARLGFALVPDGFFDRNPSAALAPAEAARSW